MNQRRTVVPRGAAGRAPGAWVLAAAAAVAVSVAPAPTPAARAQAPAPDPVPAAGPGQDAAAPAVNQATDLTTRYRFIERYAPAAAAGARPPGEIGQYRVASRDVLKVVAENPQGAPDRKETTVQVIYAEKPVTVGSAGAVTAVVRRYDALRVTPQPEANPSAPKPLEGLTVWVQPRPGGLPRVFSITEKRPLIDAEYLITAQRLVFLPDLAAALPALPSRVGDRWAVSRAAAQALLGDRPLQQLKPLVGELVDVRKSPDQPEMVAEIRVTGDAKLPPNGSDTLINAQILFKFAATPQAPADDSAPAAAITVDARGAITDLRLARTSSSGMPGGNGRLRRTLNWELTLQRDLVNVGAPIIVPTQAPVPTVANSWLTYDDPRGRFHFRHPQDMHPKIDPDPESDGSLQLLDERAGTLEGRVITIVLQNKTGDAEKDRSMRDPEFHKKDLDENWARNRRDVLHGPAGWLPEAEWAPYKMKVYRIEAAEKPSGPAARDIRRIFLDHYLILFTQNESLAVDAITGQDPPLAFRKQVEEILKTFVLGPQSRPPG